MLERQWHPVEFLPEKKSIRGVCYVDGDLEEFDGSVPIVEFRIPEDDFDILFALLKKIQTIDFMSLECMDMEHLITRYFMEFTKAWEQGYMFKSDLAKEAQEYLK